MIEAYEDALKKSNKEFEEENEELKRRVKELEFYVESGKKENMILKAQLDMVHLIFGKKGY